MKPLLLYLPHDVIFGDRVLPDRSPQPAVQRRQSHEGQTDGRLQDEEDQVGKGEKQQAQVDSPSQAESVNTDGSTDRSGIYLFAESLPESDKLPSVP